MASLSGKSISRIGIFRPLSLGDFIVATPALRALRHAFADAHIDYIGLPWMHDDIMPRFSHLISRVVTFPGFPGLPERSYNPAEVIDFFRRMQQNRYDLLVQVHGRGMLANPIGALFNAKITAGFFGENCYQPNRNWFCDYPQDKPESHRLVALLNFLGLPARGYQLEFPISDSDFTRLETLPETADLAKDSYVCIHPGSYSSRPWKPEYFAAVANWCIKAGFSVVFTGTARELELVKYIARLMRGPSINLVGRTSLGMLAALLSRSRLYLGNNTGVSHIAVALNIPAINIFVTDDMTHWSTSFSKRHRSIRAQGKDDLPAVLSELEDLCAAEVSREE